ncbi:MAG: rod-binding protein [Fimbriimonas sp.]|nr:rod-binding protein [Fimbriimonas sp.]
MNLEITNALKPAVLAHKDLARLKKASDGLEAFMFKSLIQQMGGKKGLFGSDVPGAGVYKDMFEQNLSDLLSQSGQLGISKTIYRSVAPMAAQQAIKSARYHQTPESKLEKKA